MVGTKRVVQNMLQSGIKACSGLFGGDHRSLLIDVYLLAAQLKGKINDLHNDQNQGLNGKDPSIFKPYKTDVFKYMYEHQIPERATKLVPLPDQDLDKAGKGKLEKGLNGIDKYIQWACLHAKQNNIDACHDDPYSPTRSHQLPKPCYHR